MAVAASRAGASGLLIFVPSAASSAIKGVDLLRRLAGDKTATGLVLRARLAEFECRMLAAFGQGDTILLVPGYDEDLSAVVQRCRGHARRVGLVVVSAAEVEIGISAGCDFLVLKGHKAGGRVGEETAFVLLQRILPGASVPVYVWGGVGWRTAAACCVAGAAGVVLDWQLALTRESPVDESLQQRVGQMDGSETAIVHGPRGSQFRFWAPPRCAFGKL